MAYKKIINEVAAKRIMDPVTPLRQILTKGCDEFRMIHSAPSYPHSVHKWWWWPSISSLLHIFLDLAVSVILPHGLVTWLANCNTKLVFQLLPAHHHDFSSLGFKIQRQYFFKQAMSIGCSAASTASGNLSKHSTGSEMGSGKPLVAYCPPDFVEKWGKEGNKETTMW